MQTAAAREVTLVKGQEANLDRWLLGRIALGDQDALAELYARHQATLYRYLVALAHDPALAEEILQDTLLAVWNNAAGFEGRSTVRTWLIGIARRQAHNKLRNRVEQFADVDILETLPSLEPEPENALLASVERDKLGTAINRLPSIHREALGLAFFNELSYQEIAQVLDVPEGTVKSRLSNAKRMLRTLVIAMDEKEER